MKLKSVIGVMGRARVEVKIDGMDVCSADTEYLRKAFRCGDRRGDFNVKSIDAVMAGSGGVPKTHVVFVIDCASDGNSIY